MTEEPVDAIWERFSRTRDRADRDKLILEYQPLVRYVASRVGVGLPQNVEQADLVSYGIFGLIDAIERFDLTRGYKFETYAMARIKGAIVDEMRGIDVAPRSIRAKARSHDEARAKLEAALNRPPSVQEIADDLGVTADQYLENVAQIDRLNVVSFESMRALRSGRFWQEGGLGQATPLHEQVIDARSPTGHAVYEVEELRATLIAAIRQMTHREAVVLHLYYREQLSLAEVGVVLGVTPSRASQIHTQIVRALWTIITN